MTTDFTPLFALNDRVRTSTVTSRHGFHFTPARIGTVIKLKRRYALVQFDGTTPDKAVWYSQRTGSERNGSSTISRTDETDFAEVRAREARLEAQEAERVAQQRAAWDREEQLNQRVKGAFLNLTPEAINFTPISSTTVGDQDIVVFLAQSRRDAHHGYGPRLFTFIFSPSTEVDYDATKERRREAAKAAEAAGTELTSEAYEACTVYQSGWAVTFNSMSVDDTSSGTRIRLVLDRLDGVIHCLEDHFVDRYSIKQQMTAEGLYL